MTESEDYFNFCIPNLEGLWDEAPITFHSGKPGKPWKTTTKTIVDLPRDSPIPTRLQHHPCQATTVPIQLSWDRWRNPSPSVCLGPICIAGAFSIAQDAEQMMFTLYVYFFLGCSLCILFEVAKNIPNLIVQIQALGWMLLHLAPWWGLTAYDLHFVPLKS